MSIVPKISFAALVLAVAGDAHADTPPAPAPIEKAWSPSDHIKYGIDLQTWICEDTAENCAAVPGLGDATYRIRRAELSAKGEIIPNEIAYGVMIDPAKTLEPQTTMVGTTTVKQPVSAISALQDLYATYVTPYADVSIGQFKIPVSWEGYNSSSKLLFPERAYVATKFGDKRDLGIKVTKAIGSHVMYMAGIYDGQSANNLDANDQKDATLRVEVYPIEGLMIGAVTYDSVFQRELAGTKDRWEGDVRFERDGVIVQAEAIVGRDVVTRGTPATTSFGTYAAVAYMLPGHIQPAFRFGYFDPNVHANVDPTMSGGADELKQYDAGVDYYVQGQNAKLQAVFTTFDFDQKKTERQAIVAAQVSF